jgi:hypothetical protein
VVGLTTRGHFQRSRRAIEDQIRRFAASRGK